MLHIFLIKNEKHLQISLSKSQWYDLLFLRYRAKQTVIRNFTSFFALYPPKNLKNQNFEKWKNLLEISSFYTCPPKITIIWCTVPEIRSETDIIFVILGHILPFYHPLLIHSDPENQNFEKKWKKCLEILSFYTYMCTINEDHMIYGSWNIRCDRQKFLTFWAIFCPFNPLTTWKIKILTLKKAPGDIIILHICTINDNHMMYGSWDIKHDRLNFLLVWTIFCPFTPLRAKKIKIFKKIEKSPRRYYHFTNINTSHMMYGS